MYACIYVMYTCMDASVCEYICMDLCMSVSVYVYFRSNRVCMYVCMYTLMSGSPIGYRFD